MSNTVLQHDLTMSGSEKFDINLPALYNTNIYIYIYIYTYIHWEHSFSIHTELNFTVKTVHKGVTNQWRTEGVWGIQPPTPQIPKLGQIPRSVDNKSITT
jgi:hypothetical protein